MTADSELHTWLETINFQGSVCITGGGAREVLDFAHFANGASNSGARAWTSDLVFVNVGSVPVRPALYFYDTEGQPITAAAVVDITGDLEITEDGALTVLTAVESLGELTISTHGRGDQVSGSVKVLSGGPIGGVLRFYRPGIGVAGVGTSTPMRDALFPARRLAGGINTGVAIHSLEEEPLGVRCRLMKEESRARRDRDSSGGQRADVLVHRRGVYRRRYVRLRGVGALRRAWGGSVHRSGGGARCRQPHLHHTAAGSGFRDAAPGIVARC